MTQTKVAEALASLSLTFLPAMVLFSVPAPAHAAVSDWFKGASLVPTSSTDFGSDATKQSIKNLHDTGANYAVLVIPIYQSNIGSTDVAPGWNTPTDDSLGAAIDYAHSLGMSVALKIHLESYDGQWRAHINPVDRDGWFANYGAQLLHFAAVAQSHHAEMIVIGTELVSMTSTAINNTNTSHWLDLIAKLRTAYTGKLTYSANSNDNSNDLFNNEKKYVGFWSALDYAGLSSYYTLSGDGSVSSLKSAWNNWNNNDIKGFAQSVGKQVIFTEVGYRSVAGAHNAPWDYNLGGAESQTEQANDYEALMSYWNDYSYIGGVFWWDWKTNPNAGGGGTDYTPQHKQAQSVMQKWFSTPTQPQTPPSQPSFTLGASPSPGGAAAGAPINLNVSVHNNDGPISGMLVDIEVYDQNNKQVFQSYHGSQPFSASQTQTYAENWTPAAAGVYTVKVGIFSNNWGQTYSWNDAAAQVTISGGTVGGPNQPGGGTPPPTGSAALDVWWPTNGITLQGTQPLKAMLEGYNVSQYQMFWQVDSGGRVGMYDSAQDYPHKEAQVDFTNWTWKGGGPYTLTFTAVGQDGSTLAQKSVNIYTAR